MRPTLDETFITIAQVWATRSTCSSSKAVGAVIVNDLNQVIAAGYNGSARGDYHCDEVGCDDNGKTHRVIHAELNAIIQLSISGVSSRGARIYVTNCPCIRCAQAIVQAQIKEVIYLKDPLATSLVFLAARGVRIRSMS